MPRLQGQSAQRRRHAQRDTPLQVASRNKLFFLNQLLVPEPGVRGGASSGLTDAPCPMFVLAWPVLPGPQHR